MTDHSEQPSGMSQDTTTRRIDALVFIHGFLDCGETWAPLLRALPTSSTRTVAIDLAGAGRRRLEAGPFTLERATQDVLGLIQREGFATVGLVGHSMGAQVAELVAWNLMERVAGMLLLTPAPLEGNVLSDDVRRLLRESGGDPEAQRQIRALFSRNLADADLDRAVAAERLMGKDTVRSYYDAFTTGDPRGTEKIRYAGPTMLVGGGGDPVIPTQTIRDIRSARFPLARLEVVQDAGHWPQLEQTQAMAELVASMFPQHRHPRLETGERPVYSVGHPES